MIHRRPADVRLLGALGAILVAALACSSPPAPPPSSAGPEASASLPSSVTRDEPFEAGQTIVEDAGSYIFAGTDLFAIAPGSEDALTVYDASTGEQLSQPTRLEADLDCGLVLRKQSDGQVLVLGVRESVTPPSGIESGRVQQELVAFGGTDLSRLWATVVNTSENNGSPTSLCDSYAVSLERDFRITTDGRFGLAVLGLGSAPVLVDLTNGASTPMPDALTVVGNWVVIRNSDPGSDVLPLTVEMLNPRNSSIEGRTTDRATIDAITSIDSTSALANDFAASVDGRSAVVYDGLSGGLYGITLPSLNKTWEMPVVDPFERRVFVGDTGVVAFPGTFEGELNPLTSIDIEDGRELWRIDDVTARCAVHGSVVTVVANEQLAFVSATDGKQLAVDPSTSECPEQSGGIIVVSGGASGGLRIVSLGPA